ncbi:hypothetical protein PFISCL1PPCAC_23113, partial [Pristionchus fissidentatus]
SETLTGIVVFRLELFPIFHQLFEENINWAPFLSRLAYWETKIKNDIAWSCSTGFPWACEALPQNPERVQYPWWRVTSADRYHNLEDEYALTD